MLNKTLSTSNTRNDVVTFNVAHFLLSDVIMITEALYSNVVNGKII